MKETPKITLNYSKCTLIIVIAIILISLLHPHEFSDNFSDMDGFQDGGYICAQGVLSYHLIKVPCIIAIHMTL